MHFEILAEEASMAEALDILVPQILPADTSKAYPHQGKTDLLAKLDARLRSYAAMRASWAELRVVIVVDRDNDDCHQLKQELMDACSTAGCGALCRIAVEELEAWFFGDVAALRAAYPKVPANLGSRASFRDPDAIAGGTWEALERILREAGYYPSGMPKVEVARRVASCMQPDVNSSRSFQVFRDGLRSVA
jgi:Domain of unknown function (DUF4276)